MARYWTYIDSKIQGPFEVANLRRAPGFNLLSQVCMEGQKTWSLADDVLEIKSYFLAPPRASTLPIEFGNTALKVDVEPEAAPAPARTNVSPLAVLGMGDSLVEELPAQQMPPTAKDPAKDSGKKEEPRAGTLRALCEVCGYKNPRDVAQCMKCGTPIAAPAAKAEPAAEAAEAEKKIEISLEPTPAAAADSSGPLTPILEHKITGPSPMRHVWLGAALGLFVAGGFFGVRSWKKHHAVKKVNTVPLVRIPEEIETPRPTAHGYSKRNHHARHSYNVNGDQDAAQLPGVSAGPSEKRASRRTAVKNSDTDNQTPDAYRVVAEATPLKHRESSPADSPYAQKRRSDKTLWNAQQEQAIRQVQRTRLYGGQRTLQRNVEILMQLLRDREYNTAFETGRRLLLYNDLDWSASVKDGPIYEVRLTFSGGREEDGTPRKPLHFAFNADLERGTVEPGGDEATRNNTMHAFFDESRIPPEERRPIAKDVEELVMAADPNGSPLALDTVVRNFAATYNKAALDRVARAFNLEPVKKKLKHDPRLGQAMAQNDNAAAEPEIFFQMEKLNTTKTRLPSAADVPSPIEAKAAAPTPALDMKSDFAMEHGSGHDRILQAQVSSKASPDRLWEALTSYDRFKLFVPDVLESEREGQDGSAIIVHTISLSRWGIFTFKINLHLRIIERPTQKIIEFERIAGDFETFRGSFEIQTNPTTQQSTLVFHSTLAPKGTMPDFMLRGMAKRFILTKLTAFVSRAEAN